MTSSSTKCRHLKGKKAKCTPIKYSNLVALDRGESPLSFGIFHVQIQMKIEDLVTILVKHLASAQVFLKSRAPIFTKMVTKFGREL